MQIKLTKNVLYHEITICSIANLGTIDIFIRLLIVQFYISMLVKHINQLNEVVSNLLSIRFKRMSFILYNKGVVIIYIIINTIQLK